MQTKSYQTKDLAETAALLTQGFRFWEFHTEDGRVLFAFPVEAEKIGNEFWRGELMVNAKEFASYFRDLKRLVKLKGGTDER